MKKRIVKIVAATALGFLLAMNIGTSMEFSLGGTEVKAQKDLQEMTCWSQIKFHLLKDTTWCPGCTPREHRTNDAGPGTCG